MYRKRILSWSSTRMSNKYKNNKPSSNNNNNNVIIYMLSFSEVAINIIVAESMADNFVNALHDKFVE